MFKICSPAQRENVGNRKEPRRKWPGKTHALFSGRKQNVHQNTSKGKPITFYFQKALIFYSYHYVLKSTQVFIGSAIATPSQVVKEEIPVFQVVLFAHSSCLNSHPIGTGTAVTRRIPGVAVVRSHPGCPSVRLPGGFCP